VAAADSDGHRARTERTRAAILDALLELLREGELSPGVARIAERAGVSKRSIFVHYASLEALHQDLAERGTQMVLDVVRVIDPSLPLAERVTTICDQRARVHESIGPLRRAASLRVASSPTAARSQQFSRQASRDQVVRVFAPELGALTPGERRRRTAAIDALLSGDTWDLWRGTHGLDVGEATRAMAEALARLLEPPRPTRRRS
jgi:AcrR family transcriptional regulator